MAAGVALTISNTRAVLEALFRVETAFARTPKFAIEGTQKVVQLQAAKYRSRSGWLPFIELAIGNILPGDDGLRRGHLPNFLGAAISSRFSYPATTGLDRELGRTSRDAYAGASSASSQLGRSAAAGL